MRDADRCRKCGVRYQQGGGFCRRCAREEGVDKLTTRERDALRLERLFGPPPPRVPEPPPAPRRTVIIAGVEYEVVFDGVVHRSGRYPPGEESS